MGPLAKQAAAARQGLVDAGFERVETEVEGGRLVVFRGGDGPHLVLLHGSGQQAGAWAAVAPALAYPEEGAGYTVHVPDLPGHGDSGPAGGALPMARLVAGVEGYVGSLDGPAIVVGNSLGAWLTTIQAHRHPETVARAVLVNGGALLNIPAEGLTLTPTNREEARKVMAAIRDPESPRLSDEELDDLVRRSEGGATSRMMQDLPGLMGHLLDGRLGEVEVPVEIVWGTSDGLIPLAYAERMESQLPRARLTTIETCGHIPGAECPERLLATLKELLAEDPPAAKAPAATSEESEEPEDPGA